MRMGIGISLAGRGYGGREALFIVYVWCLVTNLLVWGHEVGYRFVFLYGAGCCPYVHAVEVSLVPGLCVP